MLSRRGLITGLISLAAAPAIVRAASLMPIKVMEPTVADIYDLIARRIREAEARMVDLMNERLYGDGMVATTWYANEGHHEPIAFNSFFSRVELPKWTMT